MISYAGFKLRGSKLSAPGGFRIKVFKRFSDLYCGKVDFSHGEGSLEGV